MRLEFEKQPEEKANPHVALYVLVAFFWAFIIGIFVQAGVKQLFPELPFWPVILISAAVVAVVIHLAENYNPERVRKNAQKKDKVHND